MAVFQPAEETGEGAQAMIDDGLFERFPKPDVVLGQHVMVGPAGDHRRARRGHHLRGRQPADPPVRARRARLDAAGQHRSGGDGGGDGDAAADHRLARARRRRRPPWSPSARCRPAPRRTSSPTKPSSSSTCAPSTRACASACSPRSTRIVNAEAAASGAPEAAGDHAARPLSPGRQRSATATERVADAFRRALLRRARARDRTDAGERGLRIVRRRVARAVGVLVRRRHRPGHATRKPRRRTGSTRSRPTTTRALRRSSIRPCETGVEALIVAARAWLAA